MTNGVKTYRGRSLEELLPQVREELGPEAVVLRRREGLAGGVGGFFQRRFVEIDARGPLPEDEQGRPRNDRATAEGFASPAVRTLVEQAQPFAEALARAEVGVAARAQDVLAAAARGALGEDPDAAPDLLGALRAARPEPDDPAPAVEPGLYGPQRRLRDQPEAAENFIAFDAPARGAPEGAAFAPAPDTASPQGTAFAAPAPDTATPPSAAFVAPEHEAATPGAVHDAPLRAPATPHGAVQDAPLGAPGMPRGAVHDAPLRAPAMPPGAAFAGPEMPAFAAEAAPRAVAPPPVAAPEPPAFPAAAPGRPPEADAIERALVSAGLSATLAADVVGEALAHDLPFDPDAGLKAVVRRALARRLPAAPSAGPGARVIAVAGAGGAGKTATCEHLAAAYARAGQSVVVVALRAPDGGRALAAKVEPLGVTVFAAAHSDEVEPRLAALRPQLVLVDCPAVRPGDPEAAHALAADLATLQPGEVHLALPATLSAPAAEEATTALAPLGITHLVLAHADETARPGAPVERAIRAGRPLAFETTSAATAPLHPLALAERLLP